MIGQRIFIVPLLLIFAVAADAPSYERSGTVRSGIAAAIEARDAAGVLAGATALAEMGGGLSQARQARIAPFLTEAQRASLAERFRANAVPIAESEVLTTISEERHLVEGIAYDPDTGRLFVGTVVDGWLVVREDGAWRSIIMPETLGGLFGMAFDAKRRRLWVANGLADPVARPEAVRGGLVEIDTDRMTMARHRALPEGATGTPGDVALGPDGTVYVSDGIKGAIYRCPPGCGALEPFVAEGEMESPQGMVVSHDGRWLIVADYARGLARVALDGRRIEPLTPQRPAMLDGIDGLVRDGRSLIAVQNGTVPRRIIRISLTPDEQEIAGIDIIERANPEWGEPTLGTMIGGRFAYVADGQWERYGKGGKPQTDTPPQATPIRILRLR